VITIIDDHLLRDWMARPDPALVKELGTSRLATTNLWYARLCKTAARATGGSFFRGWSTEELHALTAGLIALPDEVEVAPMRELAWRMGELVATHSGLSTLGAEAVAAATESGARILVSARDDGPGIRACCKSQGVSYEAIPR